MNKRGKFTKINEAIFSRLKQRALGFQLEIFIILSDGISGRLTESIVKGS